ncbi:MmyB family transcriptional regulator [Arthrobacter sp. MDT3-24]
MFAAPRWSRFRAPATASTWTVRKQSSGSGSSSPLKQPSETESGRRRQVPSSCASRLTADSGAKDFLGLAAALSTEAGRNPRDRALNTLIGDLATGSTEFSTRWARHNVRFHRSARKTLHNPIVGDLELTGDSLELPGEGLTLIAYTAEPGSESQEKLEFLTMWSTTNKRPVESPKGDSSTPTITPSEAGTRS